MRRETAIGAGGALSAVLAASCCAGPAVRAGAGEYTVARIERTPGRGS